MRWFINNNNNNRITCLMNSLSSESKTRACHFGESERPKPFQLRNPRPYPNCLNRSPVLDRLSMAVSVKEQLSYVYFVV